MDNDAQIRAPYQTPWNPISEIPYGNNFETDTGHPLDWRPKLSINNNNTATTTTSSYQSHPMSPILNNTQNKMREFSKNADTGINLNLKSLGQHLGQHPQNFTDLENSLLRSYDISLKNLKSKLIFQLNKHQKYVENMIEQQFEDIKNYLTELQEDLIKQNEKFHRSKSQELMEYLSSGDSGDDLHERFNDGEEGFLEGALSEPEIGATDFDEVGSNLWSNPNSEYF